MGAETTFLCGLPSLSEVCFGVEKISFPVVESIAYSIPKVPTYMVPPATTGERAGDPNPAFHNVFPSCAPIANNISLAPSTPTKKRVSFQKASEVPILTVVTGLRRRTGPPALAAQNCGPP